MLIGMIRSQKKPTRKHPMGFGRESYIWSMMVAIVLFSVGGLFSIYEGWLRYMHPHEVENAGIALLILLIAIGLETFSLFSLKGALNAMAEEKGGRSLWQWFRETHSPELMVVTGEDVAALAGLSIALVMLGLTMITGDTAYDAVGSMLIGCLLVTVAAAIGREVHSLLLGETVEEVRDAVERYLEQQPGVRRVLNLWAIDHGNAVMLTVKAELEPEMAVRDAVQQINRMESEIKQTHNRIRWIFFEIDDTD
jgi:cation diffusion facilitator family transporter